MTKINIVYANAVMRTKGTYKNGTQYFYLH